MSRPEVQVRAFLATRQRRGESAQALAAAYLGGRHHRDLLEVVVRHACDRPRGSADGGRDFRRDFRRGGRDFRRRASLPDAPCVPWLRFRVARRPRPAAGPRGGSRWDPRGRRGERGAGPGGPTRLGGAGGSGSWGPRGPRGVSQGPGDGGTSSRRRRTRERDAAERAGNAAGRGGPSSAPPAPRRRGRSGPASPGPSRRSARREPRRRPSPAGRTPAPAPGRPCAVGPSRVITVLPRAPSPPPRSRESLRRRRLGAPLGSPRRRGRSPSVGSCPRCLRTGRLGVSRVGHYTAVPGGGCSSLPCPEGPLRPGCPRTGSRGELRPRPRFGDSESQQQGDAASSEAEGCALRRSVQGPVDTSPRVVGTEHRAPGAAAPG